MQAIGLQSTYSIVALAVLCTARGGRSTTHCGCSSSCFTSGAAASSAMMFSLLSHTYFTNCCFAEAVDCLRRKRSTVRVPRALATRTACKQRCTHAQHNVQHTQMAFVLPRCVQPRQLRVEGAKKVAAAGWDVEWEGLRSMADWEFGTDWRGRQGLAEPFLVLALSQYWQCCYGIYS